MARREVDLKTIAEAWSVVRENLGAFFMAGLLAVLVLTALASTFVFLLEQFRALELESRATGRRDHGSRWSWFFQLHWLNLGVGVIGASLISLVSASITRMALRALEGERVKGTDVFFGLASQPIPIMLAGAVTGFFVTCAMNCCVFPAFCVGGMLMLTSPFIIDQKMSVGRAISASWKTMSPYFVNGTALYLWSSILLGLGLMSIGYFTLATLPMFSVIQAVVYKDLTGEATAAKEGTTR